MFNPFKVKFTKKMNKINSAKYAYVYDFLAKFLKDCRLEEKAIRKAKGLRRCHDR